MKKLLKSRKALSPVVAAIILIAVTVAVSIAVAAWMGALTFTFMKTEELKIVGAQFTNSTTGNEQNLTLTVQNSGTAQAVISNMKVEDTIYTITDPSTGERTLAAGALGNVTCSFAYTNGTAYNVAVVTKAGNVFTYRATAPT